MPYKKGDVLKNGIYRRNILVALDDVYLTSAYWSGHGNSERESKMTGIWLTEYELEKGSWSLCPPDQTLLPVEKWVPKIGSSYFSSSVRRSGEVNHNEITWDADRFDFACLAIGNVHKTSEEAIEWAKKRYNIS